MDNAADAFAPPSQLQRVLDVTSAWTVVGVGAFCILLVVAVFLMIRDSSLESRLAFCATSLIPLLCGVAGFGWQCHALSEAASWTCGGSPNFGWLAIRLFDIMSSIAIGAGLTAILLCVAGFLFARKSTGATDPQ